MGRLQSDFLNRIELFCGVRLMVLKHLRHCLALVAVLVTRSKHRLRFVRRILFCHLPFFGAPHA